MLIQFLNILRKSNLVPDSKERQDKTKVFLVEDMEVSYLAILADIKWTESTQYTCKAFRVPALAVNKSRL